MSVSRIRDPEIEGNHRLETVPVGFRDGKLGSKGEGRGVLQAEEGWLVMGSNHQCGDIPHLVVNLIR